jgi:2Fe-2S ferredoxin
MSGPLRIRFEPAGIELLVDRKDAPFGHDGRPFSILDIALGHGIEIEHQCGGNLACSTCHVIIKKGFDKLSEPTEKEEDYLDKAEGPTPTSRLACQAVPRDDADEIVVQIPKYTRNVHFKPPPGAE